MRINSLSGYNYSFKLNNLNLQTNYALPEIKDTFSFSGNNNIKYIDESTPLLCGYEKKPLKDFNDFSLDKMCLVHMTNYFPKDGEIKPVNIATKDDDGIAQYRSTIHSAINHSVKEHGMGNSWQTMKYAIILPMDKVFEQTEKENLLGGRLKDFYIKGCVKIPDNSIIVRQNSKIPKGKLKIINASETMDDFKGTKGIKIVESSNPNTGTIANMMVSKMGYTHLDKLAQKCSGLTEEEYRLMSDAKYSQELLEKDSDMWFDIKQNFDIQQKAQDFRILEEKSWDNFTKKYDLSPKNHANSPWGRSEALIECIKLVGAKNNSWTKEFLSQGSSFFNEKEIKEISDLCDKADEYTYEELKEIFHEVFNPDLYGEVYNTEEMAEEEFRTILKSMNPIRKVDYKKEFLKIIDEIKEDLPEGKTLGFDIDVLSEIIKEAKTPNDALKEIKNRLNLIPMVPLDKENKDIPDDIACFELTDLLLGLSDIQKQGIKNNAAATLV